MQCDERNPNDVSNQPHELTHGPDAIRGFCSSRPSPTINTKVKKSTLWMFNTEEKEEGYVNW